MKEQAKKKTASKQVDKVPATKKKVEKKTTPAPKKPKYLKKGVTEFVVGTEDYRKIIEDHNKIFGTMWNPWRCRPQVFYTIWQAMQKHYE